MSRFAVDRLFMFVLRGFSASKLSRQSGHAINKISSLSGVAKSSERKKNAENKSARRGVAKFSFLRANPGRDWTRTRLANIFYRPIAPQCGSFDHRTLSFMLTLCCFSLRFSTAEQTRKRFCATSCSRMSNLICLLHAPNRWTRETRRLIKRKLFCLPKALRVRQRKSETHSHCRLCLPLDIIHKRSWESI